MNIINYINKYGDITLEERDITEIDKLIFGILSYVKYDGIVSNNKNHKRTIHDVGSAYFKLNDKKKLRKNILAVRSSIKVLGLIMNKKRYRDLLLYNDIYIADEKQQFSAITIEINPSLVYVSFEGTDQMISGWEEDFKMSYKFPVDAQVEAIKYLNKNFTFSNKRIIVGGHSKGGNLALVSSMYTNFIVRSRIINIYSYDGPGLREKQILSKNYKRIKNKFIHIVSNNSIIGLLLRHDNDYVVIKSNKMGLLAHAAESWQVNDDNFVFDTLSTSSKVFEQSLMKWFDKYNDEERKEFVTELFDIFRKENITDIVEIMNDPKLLLKLLKDTVNIDKTVRKMIKELGNILVNYTKQTIANMFSNN